MLSTSSPLVVALSLCASLSAQARAFGEGCTGHLPSLPSMGASAPLIAGKSVDLRFDTVAPGASFLLVIGTSDKTWSGATLPLDMSAFGFPGCFLNVAFDKAVGLVSDPAGKFVLPVPGAALVAGARFFAQMVVPEPNGPRLSASQGYELTVQKSLPPFSVFVLPDTQYYVTSDQNNAHFVAQTDWVVKNRATRNAALLSHVGDVVAVGAAGPQNNKAEWDRAEVAMSALDGDLRTNPDGLIPYSNAVGNRDFDVVDLKTAANQFDSYFGPARFAGRSWFGGFAPNRRSTWQVVNGTDGRYLHLALEWRAADDVIAWARNVLVAHPELPAILTTHQLLGMGSSGVGLDDSGSVLDGSGDNGGRAIQEKVVEPFPQVFLVLCGHNLAAGHRTHQTALGQDVHELLMDYSLDPGGGNGWMHDLVFRPDLGELQSICLSPTYKPGVTFGPDRRTRPESNYTLGADLHAHRRMLETTRTVHFVDGYDHGNGTYTGGLDTFVSSASATLAFGSRPDIEVIELQTHDKQQGLLQFGGLFGTGAGQVPRDRRIVRAILTLTTEGAGSPSAGPSDLYRLTIPFDESSTWSSLNQGISVGTDTVATPDATTGARVAVKGTQSFDVTSSVRAWQAGAANHGWAVINAGQDSWSFRSRDWAAPAERPMLTVVYER